MNPPALTTPPGFRVVQVFLSPELTGASEVALEIADRPRAVHCTCGTFKAKGRCKHGDFVRKRVAGNGTYMVTVANSVPDEVVAVAANAGPDAFREFVLRYGKVEVL